MGRVVSIHATTLLKREASGSPSPAFKKLRKSSRVEALACSEEVSDLGRLFGKKTF